ncbi:hypothetical protein KDM41_13005 [bacterium]|nr:hypothetical protein [bacterium]
MIHTISSASGPALRPSRRAFAFLLTVALVAALVAAAPRARADVAIEEPDTGKDLPGLLLTMANLSYAGLAAGPAGRGELATVTAVLGLGLGAGSVALGATETVGLEGLVIVTGVASAAVGILGLARRDGPARAGEDHGLSRGPTVVPLGGFDREGHFVRGLAVAGAF